MDESDQVEIEDDGEDSWEIYSYGTDNGPVFVTFNTAANDIPRDEFPFCARIIIPIKQPDENDGPDEEEAEVLWGLEDDLTEALETHDVACVMLARITHAGKRELVFQVADWESFRAPVDMWLKKAPDYEVDVTELDGWDFFDESIWPSADDWIMIFDRQVVDNLIESGSDPQKEHDLEYVFDGDSTSLQKLQQELEARDYVSESSKPPTEQLVMVKKLALDMHLIWHESLENHRLCEELNVEFLGWGAAIVR
jgi:hypothetical protein